MTDDQGAQTGQDAGGAAAAAENQPAYQIRVQYVKDLSFENPKAPACYVDPKYRNPTVAMGLDVTTRPLGARMAEVSVQIEARARTGEDEETAETVYIAELVYGAVVQVGNIADDQIEPLLVAEVPRVLFPYIRNILCEATRDGGHSMLLMAPVDFAALYHRKRGERGEGEPDPTAAQIAGESLPEATGTPGGGANGSGAGGAGASGAGTA